ncbi:hypothetical protein AB1Y20_004391 [Prymnesium parvum]|uniref:AB hydrolase-1 domain-containing protein n=1 Tax=Prymnesium parvum TaxID=97485 RepID=A0AB34IW86_PRYPA
MALRLASRHGVASVALHSRTAEPPTPTPRRPPLLLLHGLFGSSSNFRQLARRCSEALGVRAFHPDLRNHGLSPWTEDCSFEAMAADIVALLDRERVGRATLCGHSLGGKAVMAAAMLHPDRVAGVICVDIAPLEYAGGSKEWRGNEAIKAAMHAMPAEAMKSRAAADVELQRVVADAGVRQFLLQNLIPDERRWRLNLAALIKASDVLRSFPQLPAAPPSLPACFIAGEKSNYLVSDEQRAAARACFPSASFETAPTGHWVHAEAPDLFVQLVCNFCKQLPDE